MKRGRNLRMAAWRESGASLAALWACLLAVLLVFEAEPARSQSKTGTAIAEFTLIEPSARIAAMGNAGVALHDGLQCAYYNPAAIGFLRRPEVQFTHSEWLAEINYEYAAGTWPLGAWGNLLGSVTALRSGEIAVRTVEHPRGTGERYSVTDVALGVGVGREFTDRFAAGVQLNYISETIWNSSLSTMTLNVGTLYRLTANGVKIGASITNFGTGGSFDGRDLRIQYDMDPDRYGDNSALPGSRATDDFPVPVLFRLGMSWPVAVGAQSRVRMAADAFHSSSNTESVNGGVEWSWRETLAARAGYQGLGQEDAESGLTLGLGLRGRVGAQRFELDYGWADQGRLEETRRLTFVLGL